ncbi:MAG: flavin reductase family protein [Bauldia sp.]|nr:flavin reductase family protein [Bauldia sp.]
MIFDLEQLDTWSRHKLLTATIVPRPIAWVSTLDADGVANIAPFGFFNAFGVDPPVIALGVHDSQSGRSDTGNNIRATGQFVVNLTPERLLREVEVTAVPFPPEVDEFVEAGLTKAPSLRVAPPRILESPVSYECELIESIQIGAARWLIVGKAVLVHIDDRAVIDPAACYIDTRALGLVARAHAGSYVRIGETVPTPAVEKQPA